LEIKQKNGALFFFLVLFIVAAFGVWLFINRRQIQNRIVLQNEIMKQQDIATKSILEAEERERRKIAGDLHDGVGQLISVSLLNFNTFYQNLKNKLNPDETTNGDKISGLINESYDEVRSISHQMMPNALLKADLTTAVREFISKIDSNQLKINSGISGINERLNAQTETVLYRVIQESVNNVIKHSKASLLSIQLVKDDEGINLSIENNGIGFDKITPKMKLV
jgi:two-component system NarL family sensor kinase